MEDNKKIISLEVPVELKERIRVAAFEKKVSVSAFIRQTLEKELQVYSEKDKKDN